MSNNDRSTSNTPADTTTGAPSGTSQQSWLSKAMGFFLEHSAAGSLAAGYTPAPTVYIESLRPHAAATDSAAPLSDTASQRTVRPEGNDGGHGGQDA